MKDASPAATILATRKEALRMSHNSPQPDAPRQAEAPENNDRQETRDEDSDH